jgi:hypothetical protein
VNLWAGGVIIATAVAVAVMLMLVVRWYAPLGGFFADIDRSVGVFGVLGTSFAVLLAFVIFLAFESYGTAKQNAGTEAVSVNGLFGTARLLPRSARERLRGVLIRYENRSGSITPVAMTRTLKLITVAQRQQHLRITVPCDERGGPSSR